MLISDCMDVVLSKFHIKGINKTKSKSISSRINPKVKLATIYCYKKVQNRTDLTGTEEIIQFAHIGFVKTKEVAAHTHNPVIRETTGTTEVWIIIRGKIEVSLYDIDRSFLYSVNLHTNDVIIFQNGGHSLKATSRVSEIYEIKNGPYGGVKSDKQQI